MWVRFIVNKNRWTNPDAFSKAPKDFEPQDDSEDPSIFRVDSVEQARDFAACWGACYLRPESRDYLVFSDDAFGELNAKQVPRDDLPIRLRDRHYEIEGLHDERIREEFCGRVRQNVIAVKRLRVTEVVEYLRELRHEDPDLDSKILPKWQELVDSEAD